MVIFFRIIGETKIAIRISAEESNKLWDCMRQYLGICIQGLCTDHRAANDGVLTVHLRQGGIFRPDFSLKVHPSYQQPSLAYYYSIINFTKPEKVIFVGEDRNHGPFWDAFEDLQRFGLTKFDIEFQSSNLREDLMTMICAQKFVESKSTLMQLIRLGFAVQRFSLYSCENLPKDQQTFHVDPGKFDGGNHSNSAGAELIYAQCMIIRQIYMRCLT